MSDVKQTYTMFTMSTPGYYFPEVEEAINDYKNTLSDFAELLRIRDNEIQELQMKIVSLHEKLGEMHIQVGAIPIPDLPDEEVAEVLEAFRNEGLQADLPDESKPSNPAIIGY